MEQNKWQLILHDKQEDPYYEITNGTISLVASCGFVGETEEQEDAIFKAVADRLNASKINFRSGNKLELDQHIEIQKQQYEIEALQARCDRYEKALKEIADQAKYSPGNSWADIAYIMKEKALNAIANEALNGVEEKTGGMPAITSPILTDKDMNDWEQMKKEEKE